MYRIRGNLFYPVLQPVGYISNGNLKQNFSYYKQFNLHEYLQES